MSQKDSRVCGKCGYRAYDPFVPDDTVNALLSSGAASELDPTVVRCGMCADLERDARGTRYLALAVVEVAERYGGLRRVPPDILARHRRMLPDLPAGC